MRLYAGRVGAIAQDMLANLLSTGAIEVEADLQGEVHLDIESVLREYIRRERQITDEAREQISQQGLEFHMVTRIKSRIADDQGFGIGDKAIDYLSRQVIEALFHSRHVAEIYAEDHELRKVLRGVLRSHLKVNEDLDQEVRKRIKNLQEGTSGWEVEYHRVMEDLKRVKGLQGA